MAHGRLAVILRKSDMSIWFLLPKSEVKAPLTSIECESCSKGEMPTALYPFPFPKEDSLAAASCLYIARKEYHKAEISFAHRPLHELNEKHCGVYMEGGRQCCGTSARTQHLFLGVPSFSSKDKVCYHGFHVFYGVSTWLRQPS
jgi:hypothetical protein